MKLSKFLKMDSSGAAAYRRSLWKKNKITPEIFHTQSQDCRVRASDGGLFINGNYFQSNGGNSSAEPPKTAENSSDVTSASCKIAPPVAVSPGPWVKLEGEAAGETDTDDIVSSPYMSSFDSDSDLTTNEDSDSDSNREPVDRDDSDTDEQSESTCVAEPSSTVSRSEDVASASDSKPRSASDQMNEDAEMQSTIIQSNEARNLKTSRVSQSLGQSSSPEGCGFTDGGTESSNLPPIAEEDEETSRSADVIKSPENMEHKSDTEEISDTS